MHSFCCCFWFLSFFPTLLMNSDKDNAKSPNNINEIVYRQIMQRFLHQEDFFSAVFHWRIQMFWILAKHIKKESWCSHPIMESHRNWFCRFYYYALLFQCISHTRKYRGNWMQNHEKNWKLRQTVHMPCKAQNIGSNRTTQHSLISSVPIWKWEQTIQNTMLQGEFQNHP